MSTVPTNQKVLKEKAKLSRKFIKEKCNLDISYSQCLELMSQLHGFKDWNTASADLDKEAFHLHDHGEIKNIGELKKAIESLLDTTPVECECDIELKDGHEVTHINQEFTFSIKKREEGALIHLKLEYENIHTIAADGSLSGFSYPVED